MKVAITGGSGHIGNAIILELLARGSHIKVLEHTKPTNYSDNRIERIQGSLEDKESLRKLMQGCDFLIHCAAVISINGDKGGRVHQTNVNYLENVLSVAQEFPLQRIVHVSSIHAYNAIPTDLKLDETREFVSNDAYAYDKSKRDGQLLAMQYFKKGLPVIIVNPTAVFGAPDNKKCKQNSAFISLSKGKLPFVPKGGYNWVDVQDVALTICNALTQGRLGENYLLGGNYYTIKQLSKMVSKVIHRKLMCIELPMGLVKFFLPIITTYYKLSGQEPSVTKESLDILEFGNKYICSQKAIDELGHHNRPIEESIESLLTWTKNN